MVDVGYKMALFSSDFAILLANNNSDAHVLGNHYGYHGGWPSLFPDSLGLGP